MIQSHFEHWPVRVPYTLTVPETTLYDNLEISARRYPDKTAIYYYGAEITYRQLLREVDALAGFLEKKLAVTRGENVLLFVQNSPQFVIGYYAILRAGAVVVPINPMNTAEELRFYIHDCQMKTGIIGIELFERIEPVVDSTALKNVIIAAYSDYLPPKSLEDDIPEEVKRGAEEVLNQYLWKDAVQGLFSPSEMTALADDLAVLPYTSGTTGLPKGCMHTHRTVQANTFGGYHWLNATSDAICLATLPLFHVTGMVHSMHIPILSGATVVMMTRWDREYARKVIRDLKVTHWINISTMLIDFLANPALVKEDMSSLMNLAGGGAALPAAVGEKLYKLTGLKFIEGYGLSETIAQTHFNPPDRSKLQCLGIPSFDVDARVIDPVHLTELGTGQEGEIVVSGPQIFLGYFNREEENEKSFIHIEGKKFFRTGDIGKRDEEGYYFIVDRVKRMINASGFKVWPTEIEGVLYQHPAVQQACVVGVPDERRGETVKAFIILNKDFEGKIDAEEIVNWSKERMAAYKYPRHIEFRESLPMTSSGKLLWRKLQEEEKQKVVG
ncbi:long-chain fatty acid--CoA ligase [Peribacillus frigoritolerans]|uniref:long-chain fatty acid--CoA ligase n=1 Tax=Peribacillus frigoritolerans TaxID=450367 RepID=UPI00105982C4|nr:long-chain fatty acid--CoA ligase [Peribacillus frigoritolerans]TDL80980.1 long-chain fatty acid--CoA ligase [Peribacillus frigoritolerans]